MTKDRKTPSRFEGLPYNAVRTNLDAAFAYLSTKIIPQPHTVLKVADTVASFKLKVPDDYNDIPVFTLVELLHLGIYSVSSTFDDSGKHLQLVFDLNYTPCVHSSNNLDVALRDRIAKILPTIVPVQRLHEVAPLVLRTLGGPYYHTPPEALSRLTLRDEVYGNPSIDEGHATQCIVEWLKVHAFDSDRYFLHMCEDIFRILNTMLNKLGSPFILERTRIPTTDPVFTTISVVQIAIRK
mgnify:CR=1 FL=1